MEYSSDLDSRKSKKKKIDPSFKSKRYRDKLRTEVKALENLIPVDRQTLNKKLDSQTVYRLAIAYLRVKSYLKARNSTLEYTDNQNRVHTERVFGDDKLVGPAIGFKDCGKILGETEVDHVDNTGTQQDRNVSEKPGDTSTYVGDQGDELLDAATLYQVIDGFVLLASTDGTIMFVTDNISKFTGFCQVDLMHRCLYSIVHPEDFQAVKNALEVRSTSEADDRMPPASSDCPSRDKIENFFCKIRCYHGNTPGYIKLHCSGVKYYLSEMPHTTRTSKSVLMLYCQPFIKTGNDVINDERNDVFWSKHDLDLKFKEIEDSSPLGYSTADLCGKSLYQFVHPEDLCILSNVHKEVTRVTEVQTFFFRLETKGGNWLWVYCKGKVVCKNSKKFSIVFSHCPMRDNDNVFVKQETLFRRHRLASVFEPPKVNQVQPQQYGNVAETIHIPEKQRHDAFESVLQHEDNAHAQVILDIYSMSCPSSWHAASDRHSPVLPNNHAAQKTFQRERQLYIADCRRKQYLEQNMASMTSLSPRTDFLPTPVSFYDGRFPNEMISCPNLHQQYSNYHLHSTGVLPYLEYRDDNIGCSLSNMNKYGRQEFHPGYIGFQQHHPSQTNFFSGNVSKWDNLEQLYGVPNWPKYQSDIQDSGYNCVQGKHCLVSPNVPNFYSSANLRFSMVCNSEFDVYNFPSRSKVISSEKMHENSVNICDNGTSSDVFKSENDYSNCCAIPGTNVQTSKPPVKYDVEASVYMRIVEAQNTDNNFTLKFPPCNNIEKRNVKVVSK